MTDPPDRDQSPIVRESWVDLKLRAFRAEVRLLVVLSLLANQVLAHVEIPTGLTAGALVVVAAKLAFVRG